MRIKACSRATLKQYRPKAKAREALPNRSTLNPAICFLNPPMPNNTWLAGMRQFSKYNWHHCSPLMKFDGSLMEKPGVSRSISTEPMPSTPGPKRT